MNFLAIDCGEGISARAIGRALAAGRRGVRRRVIGPERTLALFSPEVRRPRRVGAECLARIEEDAEVQRFEEDAERWDGLS